MVSRNTRPGMTVLGLAAAWFSILGGIPIGWCDCEAADEAGENPAALPNVVLILADDLGWSDLGCYGADFHETPNLDRLAAHGVRFTSAYAYPVCTPTRAAILTGKNPARLNMTIWYEQARRPVLGRPLVPPLVNGDLPHEEITIAEALRPAGYLTALIGKWHLGDAAHYPETQGFDINVGGTFWGAPTSFFYPYRGPTGRAGEYRYVPHLEYGEEGEYLTDRLTDEAIHAIDAAGSRPFFLYLAHHAVHTPIEAPPDLVRAYDEKRDLSRIHQNAVYAAMVHNLDENVGRLLHHLDVRGLSENTLVIFLSDNGGYTQESQGVPVTSNAPLRLGKGSLYEGGIRIPLLVRWPGRTRPGSVVDRPVVAMDLFPTILAAAGVEIPSTDDGAIDGIDLGPILRDPDAPVAHDALFWHFPHYYPESTPVSAVREGDWKLLEFHEDGHVELYNVADDLKEANDLAAMQTELADRLRDRLRSWRDTIGASMPTPAPE